MVRRMATERNNSAVGCRCKVSVHAPHITNFTNNTASVFDSDGDFLLIEAAEHLPSWVTPTNSENRAGVVIRALEGSEFIFMLGMDIRRAFVSCSFAIYFSGTP